MDLHLPGADVRLHDGFLRADEASDLHSLLSAELPWEQRDVVIQGRRIPQPRLTAWFGDGADAYSYSGLTLKANPWTPELAALRDRIEAFAGARFNSMLANRYRAGHRDSIGMHADDERELGPDPVIASISLGRACDFVMTPAKGREGRRTLVRLTHGSLLLMGAGTQRNWRHGIDKETRPSTEERVNLTFRLINPENHS